MASANQYLRVVEFLLEEGVAGRELLGVEDTAAFIAMEDASLAIVVHPTKSGDALLEALQHQLSQNPKAHHKLIIVGGGVEMRPLLETCQPGMFERRMVQVYQLSDAGEVWGGHASRLDSSVGRALEAARLAEDPVDPVDRARLVSRVRKPSEEEAQRVKEHRSFLHAYQAVRPTVTIGAVALIVGVYGLQMTWGGGEFIPTMARMGANTDASLGAEPWRLLSSTLLHASIVHVGMNALVLYILGAHLERILGWRRQLVLLALAGLVGGLASAVRAEALLSVGASGAIWGLLGAALGIALRPGTIVPVAIVENLKRVAIINLVINLAVSFIPGIDIMAHLGGGVAGLVLTYSGLLTRGLRPVAEDPLRRRDAKRGWTLGAWAAAVATVGSLVVAVVVGRPWELGRAPKLVEMSIEGTSYRVRAPQGPVERDLDDEGVIALWVADPLTAAFSLSVLVRSWSQPGPLEPAEIETWRGRDPELPEGVELVSSTPVDGQGPPAYEERHAYPNGGTLHVRYVLFEDAEVVLSAFVFEGAREDVTAAARASVASLTRG